MNPIFLLATLFSLALAPLQSQAQGNLVANGGFENVFAAWQGTHGYMENVSYAFEGRNTGVVMDLGSSSINQTMHQMLSTEPQVPYLIRFSLLSGAGRVGEQSPPGASPVYVRWGDSNPGQAVNFSTTTWRTFEYTVVARSTQTEINFASLGTRYQLIDAISVTPVPEPSSLRLAAFTAAFFLLRRRSCKAR